jgi:hypothetical protein
VWSVLLPIQATTAISYNYYSTVVNSMYTCAATAQHRHNMVHDNNSVVALHSKKEDYIQQHAMNLVIPRTVDVNQAWTTSYKLQYWHMMALA